MQTTDRTARAAMRWVSVTPAARVVIDVLHAASIGPTVGRALAGALGVGALLAAAGSFRRWRTTAWALPAVAFVALVLVGALRSPDGALEAARLALLYTSSIATGLASSAYLGSEEAQRRVAWSVAVVGLGIVAGSMVAWASGADALDLHGYTRHLGLYASHHAHAVALGVFVTLGAFLAWVEDGRGRAIGIALAASSAGLLWFTYVRTVQVQVVVVVAAFLAVSRWWRTLGGFVVAAASAVVLHPTLRDRFGDVAAVLSGRAPEGGWGAIGSWRGHIWADSWRVFAEGGAPALLGGLGLGAHDALHKQLDPHNDWLALWYQLGIAGPALWGWLLVSAARTSSQGARGPGTPWSRAFGAYAAATFVGLIAVAGVSNDVLSRASLATWAWFLAGAAAGALRQPRRDVDHAPAP